MIGGNPLGIWRRMCTLSAFTGHPVGVVVDAEEWDYFIVHKLGNVPQQDIRANLTI